MRLRKQLFIVSLITLIVPWAGCQYVREVDTTLRKGQTQALMATARAVASRLGSDEASVQRMRQFIAEGSATSIYLHPLRNAISADGYEEEWLAADLQMQRFRAAAHPQAQFRVVAGTWGQRLYIFLRIRDENWNYFSPAQNSPLESDYLEISAVSDSGEFRHFIVYASAPGAVHVARLLEDGNSAIEHQIKGSWLEWEAGYQIELQIPKSWASNNLAVAMNGLTVEDKNFYASNSANMLKPPPIVTLSPEISKELAVFEQQGIRLAVASNNARFIAQHGEINERVVHEQHGFVAWFYNLILGDDRRPALDTPRQSGQFETPEPALALRGEATDGWYRQGSNKIMRVSTPIYDLHNNREIVGAVVADQSAESLADLTNNAFDQLLMYSVLVSTTAALTFLLYASWLSLRIRKLSSAAANVVSESGKIADNFPVFRSGDEVGDLSRSYAALLSRLREYTNYLRTLSSKLSHELRTPLAIVKTSLDNLEHERLSSQARTYADRAREGATRLTNILNSMSAASHVEQAISAAETERIPVDELLKNLKDAYEDVYKKVRFSLRIQKESNEKLEIDGSGELLVQMLDKLVDNAADFCPEQGLVELGLYRNNNTIIITVRNEGPPLPKDMQGQLFDSMVSVRDKEGPTQQGHHLGLGLYIVRLIADFHRGEVQGYNVPDNSGVIFEIRLPAAS